MVDTRPKVLSLTFAMLAMVSIFLILKEGAVSANAWALLALSGVLAAAAVMGFFQNDKVEQTTKLKHVGFEDTAKGESQKLPEPSEAGFDVPII